MAAARTEVPHSEFVSSIGTCFQRLAAASVHSMPTRGDILPAGWSAAMLDNAKSDVLDRFVSSFMENRSRETRKQVCRCV